MRFVKDLIATAALATVVAALPAGNTHVSSDTDTDTGKASITPVSPLPSGAVSVWEGSDGHVTLTGFPTAAVIVTESSSVTPATIISPHPGSSTIPPAHELNAQVTYLPKPPVGPGGGHPGAFVEGRQMLPMPSSSVSALSERQMLPMPSSSVSALSERQMLPMPSSSISALSERQMLPMPSSSISALSQRQMLPMPSSSISALSERQMLPMPSSSISALSERQMLPMPSSSVSALSARNEAYTSPGTPFGAQPDPNVAIAGAISTVTETSLHIITASLTAPSTSPTTTIIVTVTRPGTSAIDNCTSTAHPYTPTFSLPIERTTSSTKIWTKDSVSDTVPGNSATTVISTTCEDTHSKCFTYTLTPTDVVTSSSTTYTGGPPSEAMPSHPLTNAASTPPCIGSCSGSTTSEADWSALTESTSTTTSSDSTTLITVTTETTSTSTHIQTTGMGSPTPTLVPRDQDPTFSVDPSDLPTMPPKRDQDPTFSVDPTDLPTMPPKRDEDPTFSVDPSDLPTMPPFKRGDAQVSPTLTASYTITFTHFQPTTFETPGEPHNTPPPITRRDEDPTFSVDPSDLPTMPPKRQATVDQGTTIDLTNIVTPVFVPPPGQDPTFSVDPSDLPTMPPMMRRDEDPTFSVEPSDLPTMPPRPIAGEPHKHTTITNKEPGLPTHTPSPISRRDEAGPLEPRPPFTSVQPQIIPPYWASQYTKEDFKTAEGAAPTTLATSVVRSA